MKYLLAPLALAASGGVGWLVYQDSAERAAKTGKAKADAPVSVRVEPVQRTTLEDHVELVGRLEPLAEIDVRARTAGYITGLPYDVGDFVDAKQTVVELDDAENRELLAKTRAALKVAEAQRRAQTTRRKQAEKELARYKRLATTGVSTEQEQEDAQLKLDIAKAVEELEAERVEQARAEVEQVKLAGRETKIGSSLSGYVAQRFCEVGDLADPAHPLLRIVNLSKVKLLGHVVEKDYPKIRNGQSVHVTVDAHPDRAFPGKVVRKAPVLDPATRTAEVVIEIENLKTLLKPGMTARARVVAGLHRRALSVPLAAIIERGRTRVVYVVDGKPSRVLEREVRLGVTDGRRVEVLSGIEDEDEVVTLGNRLVEEGQTVKAVRIEPTRTVAESSGTGGAAGE